MSQQDGGGVDRGQRGTDVVEQWVVRPPAVPGRPSGGPEVLAGPPSGPPLRPSPADGSGVPGMLTRSFLPVLVALTVLVGGLAQGALPDGHEGSPADWLRTAVVLMAMSMGGRAVLDGSVGAASAAVEGSTALRMAPLTVTLVLLVLVARAGRRAEREHPSRSRTHLLARSLVTGLCAGIVLTVAVLLGRSPMPYGLDPAGWFGRASAGASFGADGPGTLLGTALLVSLTTAAARAAAGPVELRLPHLGPAAGSALQVLRTAGAGLAGGASVVLVVVLLFRAAVGDDLDGDRSVELAATVLLAANAVLALCLLALGVPLTFGTYGSGRADLLPGVLGVDPGEDGSLSLLDLPPALPLLLLAVAVVLGTAVRRSLRHPPLPVPGRGWGTAAAVGATAGLAAALALRISADTAGTGSGALDGIAGISAGPSLLWTPLLGAGWAVLAAAAVRSGPTLARSLPARVSRAVAGRAVRPEWAAALAGTAPAPAGRRSTAVRGGLLALAGATLLALAGLGAVIVVDALVHTPGAAAEEYLDAVAAADPDRVLGHLDAPVEGAGLLLGREVLTSGDYTPITDVRVGSVERNGRSAVVHVVYSVGGQRVEDSVEMVPGKSRYGLLRTWRVAEGLPGIEVPPQAPLRVVLAGRAMGDGWYPALPGGYTFRAAGDRLLTADEVRVVLTTDEPIGPVVLEPEVRPGVLAQAERAVLAGIERCARSTTLPAEDCPFLSTSWRAPELTDVTIEISRLPTFTFVLEPSRAAFLLVTERPGALRLTGTEQREPALPGPRERPFAADLVFGVGGWVTSTGEGLVVYFHR